MFLVARLDYKDKVSAPFLRLTAALWSSLTRLFFPLPSSGTSEGTGSSKLSAWAESEVSALMSSRPVCNPSGAFETLSDVGVSIVVALVCERLPRAPVLVVWTVTLRLVRTAFGGTPALTTWKDGVGDAFRFLPIGSA